MLYKLDELVKKMELKPHPEGGFYREVYRSDLQIPVNVLPEGFTGDRSFATSIYYLLPSNSFSAFHRIKQDETWHFYMGSPISLHIISQAGDYQNICIGNDLDNSCFLQYTVKAGDWFAAEVLKEDSYALAGCTVSPGFDYMDFELGSSDQLISLFPDQRNLIRRLTRG